MRRFFNGLVLGIILGAAAFWFLEKKAQEHPTAEQQAESAAGQARSSVSEAARHLSDALRAKLDTLDLRSDQIKDELARTGRVVRTNAQTFGQEVADAAGNARIVAEIEAKYAADSDLSVWKISVSCDDGHVKLSGTVPAADDIGKAIALAMEVKGVRDVNSTLTVKASP